MLNDRLYHLIFHYSCCVVVTQVYDVKVGDVVQVLKDETKAILLQRNHGGWNDDMKKVRDYSNLSLSDKL